MNNDAGDVRLTALERYASLRERGVLTNDEYQREKARLLQGGVSSRASAGEAGNPRRPEIERHVGDDRKPPPPLHRQAAQEPNESTGARSTALVGGSQGLIRMSNWERGVMFACAWSMVGMGLYFVIGHITAVFSILVGAVLAMSGLRGIIFNLAEDTLMLPYFVFKRTVRLSQIYDANCEIEYKKFFDMPIQYYMVNLSGDFGMRQVTFVAKSRRDQFLSLLSRYAADCHITRWR